MRLILASTSPRRKEILAKTGLDFEVVNSDYEEDMSLPLSPAELAKTLSLGKASAVAANYPDAVVIAADTFVILGERLLGKPKNPEEAREMLRDLSGRTNTILTGISVVDTRSDQSISEVVEVKVFFKELTDAEITAYVATGEPLDKAGAYALQELGGIFVEKIEGDFYGAMGLSLSKIYEIFQKLGISVL